MQTLFQNDTINESNGPFDLVIEHCYSTNNFLLGFHGDCYGLYSDNESLESALDSLLPLNIEKTTALIWSEQFSLIPAKLWDPEHISDYADRLFMHTELYEFYAQKIESADAIALFGINKSIHDILINKIHGIRIQNPIPYLIDSMIDVLNLNTGLYIHIADNLLTTIVIENNALSHCNTYRVQNNEEIVYYTTYVCKEYGLQNDKLLYGGSVSQEQHEFLEKYFHSVESIETGSLSGADVETFRYNALLNPLVYANH